MQMKVEFYREASLHQLNDLTELGKENAHAHTDTARAPESTVFPWPPRSRRPDGAMLSLTSDLHSLEARCIRVDSLLVSLNHPAPSQPC